ncbi:(Fe-S)-binding protein [Geofilum sp. OHC36d9]|uniref:(Fe-S)-binding protein n=1 Tax=Geofilum sp. OHC36d9 TaxID=3458413 RepID=UPI0040349D45
MSEYFQPFVVPFAAGFYLMGVILIIRYYLWLKGLSSHNRILVIKNLFTTKTLSACGEIFRESLIHLRIYRTNPMLGFMHMSLAFGWFLLIVGGKLETWYYTSDFLNPIWYGLFFRFFEPVTSDFFMNSVMVTFMDFSLLIVLTGVTLAWLKRMRKKMMGMSNTTKHNLPNRIALTFLWLIFPLRLLAESGTAAVHGGGGFLTATTGHVIAFTGLQQYAELPLWWAYSFSLGLFFVVLPFSRYMHIPTEMVLIFLRHWNIKDEKGFHPNSGIQAFDVHSCSSCGICLDVCPGINTIENRFQSVYFVREVRAGKQYETAADLCLNCGACTEACPVGVNLENLRLSTRDHLHAKANFNHSYLPAAMQLWRDTTEVVLFTGCMGRLNPKTTQAFKTLLYNANISFVHIDKDESICCGRPMMLAGATDKARLMMERNRDLIHGCNGKTLVTTCPICYRIFKTEYQLDIPVMHHSEYLWQMIKDGLLKNHKSNFKVSYHDPCDLGRGSNCYEPPRYVLQTISTLLSTSREREKALCCGNNLGSLSLPEETRQAITKKTLAVLTEKTPDYIVTSCPMCKQTLNRQSNVPVVDLAEMVCLSQTASSATAKTVKKTMVKIPQM